MRLLASPDPRPAGRTRALVCDAGRELDARHKPRLLPALATHRRNSLLSRSGHRPRLTPQLSGPWLRLSPACIALWPAWFVACRSPLAGRAALGPLMLATPYDIENIAMKSS